MDDPENEDLAVGIFQGGDGIRHALQELGILGQLGGVDELVDFVRLQAPGAAKMLLAFGVERTVPENPREPGADRPSWIPLARVADGDQERGLNEVLGLRRISGEVSRQEEESRG